MGSTFYSLHYHVVCATKDRRPFIRSGWRPGHIIPNIPNFCCKKRLFRRAVFAAGSTTLPGSGNLFRASGGIAALNPRLLSCIPSGEYVFSACRPKTGRDAFHRVPNFSPHKKKCIFRDDVEVVPTNVFGTR